LTKRIGVRVETNPCAMEGKSQGVGVCVVYLGGRGAE